MKIYIVNLLRDTDKRNNIISQFKKFGITNYELVEAVDGRELKDVTSLYHDKRANKVYRSLTSGEIGCALSHINVYKRIIQDNERAIILEDDVILTEEFARVAKCQEAPDENIDVLFFGYGTSNVDNEHAPPKTYEYSIMGKKQFGDRLMRCYFEDVTYDYKYNFYKIDNRMYEIDYIVGTYAYSPSIEMCNYFTKINELVMMPADYVWNYSKQITGKQLTMYGPINEIVSVLPDQLTEIQIQREAMNGPTLNSFCYKRVHNSNFNR